MEHSVLHKILYVKTATHCNFRGVLHCIALCDLGGIICRHSEKERGGRERDQLKKPQETPSRILPMDMVYYTVFYLTYYITPPS